MTRKAHIPLKEKLAAALAVMLRPDESGKLVPIIPYEHRKMMTAEQIISLFHFDHWPIREEQGGPALHFNLDPKLIKAHRVKTAKIDAPQMAKSRRIVTKEQEHARRMMLTQEPKEDAPRRKMQGRGFDKTRPRKMDGTVVRRG